MKTPFSPKKVTSDSRKHTRLPMKPLHRLSLQIAKNGPYCKIANISIGGIGFFSRDEIPGGKELAAYLNVDTQKIDAGLEVIHTDGGVVGCRFKDPSAQLVSSIEKYFVTEVAALKVNKVETRDEELTSGKTLFFRGQNNCELLIQEIDGALQRFNLILFGNYVEGDGKGALSLGEKVEKTSTPLPKGIRIFRPLSKSHGADSTHLIEHAIRFIDGIEPLSSDRKKNLVAVLTDALSRPAGHRQAR